MAIAFYVPPEYGPQPTHNNQQPPPPPPDNIIDIHAHHYTQDLNNNNLARNNVNDEREDQQGSSVFDSFSTLAFVREVLGVFFRNSSGSSSRVVGVDRERVRSSRRSRSSLAQVNNNQQDQQQQQQNQQDNQPRDRLNAEEPSSPPPHHNQLLDLIQIPLLRGLPDVVTCHAGMSLRYGSSCPRDEVIQQEDTERDRRRRGSSSGVVPISDSEEDPDTRGDEALDREFKVSLKIGVSVGRRGSSSGVVLDGHYADDGDDSGVISVAEEYRLAGARLRQIADSFQRSRSSQSTTRSSSSTPSLELNVVVTVAIPTTLVLLGAGIWYFKSS